MNTYSFSLLLGILSIVFISPLFAETQHNWERTNPGGGGAFSTIGASKSGIIIAGSDLSGVYRSNNRGKTWDVIGVRNGLTETHISGLGFSRIDGNILYFGTENGIWRSSDGGNTVKSVLSGGYITDIEFGTSSPNIGYASSHPQYDSKNGVIFATQDNGKSWKQKSLDLPQGLRILKIVIDSNNADIVYLLSGNGRFACSDAFVFKSNNGGKNWKNISPLNSQVLDIALDDNTHEVYITTMNADCKNEFYWENLDGHLYKSIDGGNNWKQLSNYTGVIWVNDNKKNTLQLIDPREAYPWNSRSGTFTSQDGGKSFQKTGNVDSWDTFYNDNVYRSYGGSFNGISKTLGEDLSDNSSYFWVNSQWVFHTSNNGATFQNIFTDKVGENSWKGRGFDNVNMSDIVISPSHKNIVYAAYFDIGIWRSFDAGKSWESANPKKYTGGWEGFGGNSATILVDQEKPHRIWASLSGNQNGESPTYLLKNDNFGDKESWKLANIGLPLENILGLSLDIQSPVNKRTLYVTAQGNVYKSTNDGNSWKKVFNCQGCRFTAVDNNIIYAGGEKGLYKSTDNGKNWKNISHGDMKSTSGANFYENNYTGIFDITIDNNNENTLYVTVLGKNKGLYKSIDSGDTWKKILTDDFIRKVALVPNNSQQIYATSSSAFEAGGYDENSHGILYSEDGGKNWIQQNQGMAYPFALAIDIDYSDNPTVFIGSPGTGFQKSLVPIKKREPYYFFKYAERNYCPLFR